MKVKKIAWIVLLLVVVSSLHFEPAMAEGNRGSVGHTFENDFRRVELSPAGVTVVVKNVEDGKPRGSFQFRFRSAAVGDSVRSFEGTQGTEPIIEGSDVSYARSGAVFEKYREIERGVEQIITLDRHFSGSGDLRIAGDVVTNLVEPGPIESLGTLTFYSERGPVLTFGPVVVKDAEGRQSEVKVELEGTRLTLVIDKAWVKTATYPLGVHSLILAQPMLPQKTSREPARFALNQSTVIPATTLYSMEVTPVWRAQLKFNTSDITGGGTSNRIEVKLNDDNSTWLYTDNRIYDGNKYTYDLILNKVRLLQDIQFLYISKPGSDQWYIKSFEFYVNGILIYAAGFDGSGLMLGVNGGHFVFSSVLRSHPLWRSYFVPAPPSVITATELARRIEGHIGDYLERQYWTHGWMPSLLRWRHGVSTFRYNSAIVVYVYLESSSGVDVWFSFDLGFSCGSGKIFVTASSVLMDYPLQDSYSLSNQVSMNMLLRNVIPLKLQSDFQKVTYTNELGQPSCPSITLKEITSGLAVAIGW